MFFPALVYGSAVVGLLSCLGIVLTFGRPRKTKKNAFIRFEVVALNVSADRILASAGVGAKYNQLIEVDEAALTPQMAFRQPPTFFAQGQVAPAARGFNEFLNSSLAAV